MTEDLEMISRRRMFSFLGAAAAIGVVGLPILTPLDAEAATKGWYGVKSAVTNAPRGVTPGARTATIDAGRRAACRTLELRNLVPT